MCTLSFERETKGDVRNAGKSFLTRAVVNGKVCCFNDQNKAGYSNTVVSTEYEY